VGLGLGDLVERSPPKPYRWRFHIAVSVTVPQTQLAFSDFIRKKGAVRQVCVYLEQQISFIIDQPQSVATAMTTNRMKSPSKPPNPIPIHFNVFSKSVLLKLVLGYRRANNTPSRQVRAHRKCSPLNCCPCSRRFGPSSFPYGKNYYTKRSLSAFSGPPRKHHTPSPDGPILALEAATRKSKHRCKKRFLLTS